MRVRGQGAVGASAAVGGVARAPPLPPRAGLGRAPGDGPQPRELLRSAGLNHLRHHKQGAVGSQAHSGRLVEERRRRQAVGVADLSAAGNDLYGVFCVAEGEELAVVDVDGDHGVAVRGDGQVVKKAAAAGEPAGLSGGV